MRRNRRLQPVPLPRPLKAKAITIPLDTEAKLLMFLHALLALLAPLLIFALVGCDASRDGEPVDYGVQASSDDIIGALEKAIEGIDPAKVEPGAHVKFATTQSVALGQYFAVVADTTQTILEKDTSLPDREIFKLVETAVRYKQGAPPDVVTNVYKVPVPKAQPTPVPQAPAALLPNPSSWQLARQAFSELRAATLARRAEKARHAFADPSPSPTPNEAATPEPTPAPPSTRTSFHRLKTWTQSISAPDSIKAKANCMGLPDCQIRLRHISFDQVVWNTKNGDRTRFEFAISPDIPATSGYHMSDIFAFYPGLFKSCVTMMVVVGEGGSQALLTQCQSVFDFSFKSEAP